MSGPMTLTAYAQTAGTPSPGSMQDAAAGDETALGLDTEGRWHVSELTR